MSTLLTPIDYILIAIYFIILMGIGIYLQKKASNSIEDYFIGGRRLPGWLLGIAGFTQFVDITGTAVIISFLYMLGPKGMLIELRGGLAIHMAVILVWAGKWHRRSGCITAAEWMIFRFGNGPDGKAARAITAVAMQIFTIGMVIYLAKGVGIFFSTFLPYSPQACSLVVILIACLYTAASGFYGVVFTDLFQGFIIIAAVLVVTVLAVQKTWFDPDFPSLATSISGMKDWTGAVPHWKVDMPEGYDNYNFLTVIAMFYLLKSVINGLGGGSEPKYFGARNDRECGTLTFLWTSLMALRWPMMVGFAVLGIYFVHQNIPDTSLLAEAAGMIKNTFAGVTHQQWETTVNKIIKNPAEYPALVAQLRDLLGATWSEQIRLTSFYGTINPERILPVVILNTIPIGLKGLLLIALTSACMSTFDGNVNWAVGLITRDLYQGFLRPNASTRELIRVSWIGTVAIGLIGYFMAFTVKNINDIWGWLMMALGTGFFVPSAIKFYWQRYNGWGFTTGMAMGIGSAIVQRVFWPEMSELWQFVLTGSLSLAGSIIGTLVTRPMDQKILKNFYMKTKPFGLWPTFKQSLDPDLRKKVSREHFFDIISLPFVLTWHYLILLVPVLLVIGNFNEFIGAAILLVCALAGMYMFWYKKLPQKNFYEDAEDYEDFSSPQIAPPAAGERKQVQGKDMNKNKKSITKRANMLFLLMFLAISCSPLLAGEASQTQNKTNKPASAAPAKVSVGAYYYPWYRNSEKQWQQVMRLHLKKPQLPKCGLYDSRDPEVIGEHIEQSVRGGISFWAVSWWGPGGSKDRTFKNHILTHPDASKLKYAILYESTGRLGRFENPDYSNWMDDLRYLKENYFDNPNYLKIDGKPVVFVYLSRVYFRNRGKQALDQMRRELPEIYLVGDDVFYSDSKSVYKPEWAQNFDAVTAYDVYGQSLGKLGCTPKAVKFLARNYRQAKMIANSVGTAFMPAIAPGYNDTAVRKGHPGRARYFADSDSSKEGDLFRAMIRAAALPNVDPACNNIMMITSFNEWYEDTQIEATTGTSPPSRTDDSKSGTYYTGGQKYYDYGYLYLDILKQEVEKAY